VVNLCSRGRFVRGRAVLGSTTLLFETGAQAMFKIKYIEW
jgi:hypothetical protein